jgi:hypothetical protein
MKNCNFERPGSQRTEDEILNLQNNDSNNLDNPALATLGIDTPAMDPLSEDELGFLYTAAKRKKVPPYIRTRVAYLVTHLLT